MLYVYSICSPPESDAVPLENVRSAARGFNLTGNDFTGELAVPRRIVHGRGGGGCHE